MCMDYAAVPAQHIRGTPFIGAGTPYYAGPGGNLGAFMAWDATTGKKVWEIKEQYPELERRAGHCRRRGVLRHARRLVQGGRREDRQAALSKFKVGSGVVGNPITYRGPDGKQYVAVYAGIGGDWFLLSGDVRSDDPADVRATVRLHQGHRTAHQPGWHRLDLRALTERKNTMPTTRRVIALLAATVAVAPPAKQGRSAKAQATGAEVKADDRIPAGGVLPAANALSAPRPSKPQPGRGRQPVQPR